MKIFHQQLVKQLIVTKPAAVVKEAKHLNKSIINFVSKNSICIQYFCFKYITIYKNYDKNKSKIFW
jgi:hypothetical protein